MRLGAYQTNVQRIHVLGKDQTYHKEWLKLVVKNERKEEEDFLVFHSETVSTAGNLALVAQFRE